MVSVTSARPRAGRPDVPAKTTSSILPPRSGLTPCWPITHENASTTFDLPDPFGPTTQVIPGSNRSVVVEAKDLNPRSVRVFRYTACSPHQPVLVASLRRAPPNLTLRHAGYGHLADLQARALNVPPEQKACDASRLRHRGYRSRRRLIGLEPA